MSKTRELTTTAIFIALMCAIAPLSIPLPGAVPISLATLIIMLSTYILGTRGSLAACAVYLILGAVGLPVFSGYAGGVAKLIGPTGGYLFGYLLLAALSGIIMGKEPTRTRAAIGFAVGTAALYTLGTVWLAVEMHMSAKAALMAGVIPFIPGDLLKIALTVWIAPIIRKRVTSVSAQK